MKNPTLLLITLFLIVSCKNERLFSETDLIKEGIPYELATLRKSQLSDINYYLAFNIPEQVEEPISSQLDISLQLHETIYPLILDFNEQADRITSVRINEKEIPVRHEKEHLIIAPEYLAEGLNTVSIVFLAGELSLNRNEDYLYTLLVPDRASTVFPCFDQPDLKATYQLEITAPRSWKVLAGAPKEHAEEKGAFTTHHFAQTELMSTYLFSFVAGAFQDTIVNPGKFDMRLLYRETDENKIHASITPIFNQHQDALAFLEDYTAYPFPFEKMDFATIPGFQYGGMEHVGAIQYRESSLFLDSTATESRKLSRAKLIAHETSHMWFGDLVTMKWFDDVWLKEVFANFMADKIVNPAFPEIDHELSFILNHYPRAYGEDRTKGANPIRQQLGNLKDAGSLYGAIIYNKAPIMMNQLESLIGKEALRSGLQEYLKTFANDNADWNDLISILDKKTDHDLKSWSNTWTSHSGRPVISENLVVENGKINTLELRQQAEDGSTNTWQQTFSIGLVYPDTIKTVRVNMTGKSTPVKAVSGWPEPQSIIYNYNGMGYGVFPVDPAHLEFIPQIKNDVARTYSLINIYENALNGIVAPEQAYKILLEALVTENNELILNRISGEISHLFWNYLTADQRKREQVLLEDLAWKQMQRDVAPNMKKTFFGLFRSVAWSEKGKARLYQIWSKKITIDGLRLNEDDYTSVAMTLALFGHENTTTILEQAKAALKNPDKIKRFEFIVPALSADVTVRDQFFNSLKLAQNREKESWVLSALGYLNHPLRQDTSIRYLGSSLELLQEIQKTGDIFFPKGWLSATIGQYTSEEAYGILQEFLEAHPNFNPILLNKLYQASDDLYRNHELRTQ